MEEHKISIIVPIYNVEGYLEHCIESICHQTYCNLEIILVDDGSTDSSGAICERYAAYDRRIHVIHQKNMGVVAARKAGLKHASGRYIGLVDGDDYLEPEMYKELLEIMLREQVDFVHSGYYVDEKAGVYGTGKTSLFEISGNRLECLRTCVLNPISDFKIAPSNWSKLYSSELIKEAYSEVPDTISYGEDLLFLCSCILKCKYFYILDKAYYHYVTRANSVCNQKSAKNIQRESTLYNALRDLFRHHGLFEELRDSLERFYLYSVTACIKHLGNSTCPLYKYPDIQELVGKKIILYGAGEVGQDYYTQFRRDMRCEVLAVTDTRYESYHFEYMNLISPEEIVKYPYDVIVIAVLYEGAAVEIRKQLLGRGVQVEKIFWKKPAPVL